MGLTQSTTMSCSNQSKENDTLLEPPDTRPSRKKIPRVSSNISSLGVHNSLIALKLKEIHAGAHPLIMASSVH